MSKKKKKNPVVLIVGRTNVGKSTLFNRLAGKRASIVFEREGVTRDYITETVSWNDKVFDLVDTGGFMLKKKISDIDKRIQEKVRILLDSATILLFVVDAKNGLTQYDLHIAKVLHRTNKPIILLLNKADNTNALAEHQHEFVQLGMGETMRVSGIHGIGTGDLLTRISELVPEPKMVEEKPQYRIAIIGKPNVGKSSLMNLLIRHERSIVSDVAGTTREAISEKTFHCEDVVLITDTAGVRRKSRVGDNLEQLMVKSSLESIRTSNIILLMVDASSGQLSDQELKLMFYVYDMNKPLIILFNKFDLLKEDDYARDRLNFSLEEYDFVLKKLPILNISCVSKRNIHKILDLVNEVIKRCKQPFKEFDLEELILNQIKSKPMYHKRQILKAFRIQQVKGAPIPSFNLLVNYPEWFGPTQLGFIENILRSKYNLKGCPVEFNLKKIRGTKARPTI